MSESLLDDLDEFIDSYYREDVLKLAEQYPSESQSLHADWMDLYRFDMDLADDYLDQPETVRDHFEEALRQYDLPIDVNLSRASVRVFNVDGGATFEVGEYRKKDREQYLAISGQVARTTEVKPHLVEGVFECQRCGTTTSIQQVEGLGYQEPHECQGCERQGPFIVDKDRSAFEDRQAIRLRQPPEQTKGGQGASIDIFVTGDSADIVDPGDRATFSGTLKLEQAEDDSPDFEFYLSGDAIEIEETDYEEIDTDAYREQIEALAAGEQGDPYDLLTDSIGPRIAGHDQIKLALALQLFGGNRTEYPDGTMDRGDSHVLLLGDPGCHAPGTELLTYDGRRVPVETIEPGDRLMGPDSNPRTVTQTASGYQQMYEIQPIKGGSFIVNEDHVLTLVKSGSGGRNEDGDIIDVPVGEYLDWPKTPQHKHKLLRTGVEFGDNSDADLPIDPYFLGVLIGDGNLSDGTPNINTDEPDMLDQFSDLAKEAGVRAVEHDAGYVSFSGGVKGKLNPLTDHLRSLGLATRSKEKHLPRQYRTASRHQRLELLAGLLDTDGYLDQSHCAGYEYSSASKELAEDVAYLARSLGFCATIATEDVRLDGWDEPRTYFNLNISGDCSEIPCRVGRKQANERKQIKNVLRTGFSVEPVGKGEYHGVTLAEDPHYVMADFTVTHNTAKSSLLRYIETIAPRSVYASGKGASAAGLTAAAVSDDFGEGKWSLDAGALVEANKGIACIDEIDKVQEDAVSSLHDALESQRVTVNKAGINATLPAETSLLAAGNPKHGRFDQYQSIGEQIDLGPTLLSRFDLIFTLSDRPDEEQDREVTSQIIESRQAAIRNSRNDDLTDAERETIEPAIEADTLQAWVAYARQNIRPVIEDDEVAASLKEMFVDIRLKNADEDDSPVPVTFRKLDALLRLAEASARVRLSETIGHEDVARAHEIAVSSLKDVGLNEDNEYDTDIVETGTSTNQRKRVKTVTSLIEEMQDLGEHNSGVPTSDVVQAGIEEGMAGSKVEHAIERLMDKGDVYEPETDHLRVV